MSDLFNDLPEFDGVNLVDMIKELERELAMRKAVYKGMDGAGQTEARQRLQYQRLNSTKSFLLWCMANRETIMATKKELNP